MLLDTPYGRGVREIKAPMAHGLASCESMLVRNPQVDTEWGIFFNGNSAAERQRITIADELGHFVLHRGQRPSFSCYKESALSGAGLLRNIKREADDFASNLMLLVTCCATRFPFGALICTSSVPLPNVELLYADVSRAKLTQVLCREYQRHLYQSQRQVSEFEPCLNTLACELKLSGKEFP